MKSEEEISIMLFKTKEAMLYKIPPASSEQGHCASEWKGCCKWKGELQLHQVGKKCKIIFLNLDGSLYGSGFIDGDIKKKIERCYDSTRYCVITMSNDAGMNTHIGIGMW